MLYRLLSKFYPKRIRKQYIELLNYLGIKTNADLYVGFTLAVGILLSLLATFTTSTFTKKFPFFLLWPGSFILFELMIYIPIMLKVDANAKKVEKFLPDALLLMHSNLKAGLTVDQALLSSARPEFDILEKELNKVGKEVVTGKSLESSLLNSKERIKSEKYKKTIDLIVSGLRSGGELANLLSQTAKNLKRQSITEQKIKSNIMMYIIFIFTAIAFGAPLLFGLSSFLINVLTEIFTSIEIPTDISTQGLELPINTFNSANLITPGFVLTYSIIALVITAIMGSLILGLISKGKEKYGLKYIPLLIAMSLITFFIIRMIISSLMQSLINF